MAHGKLTWPLSILPYTSSRSFMLVCSIGGVDGCCAIRIPLPPKGARWKRPCLDCGSLSLGGGASEIPWRRAPANFPIPIDGNTWNAGVAVPCRLFPLNPGRPPEGAPLHGAASPTLHASATGMNAARHTSRAVRAIGVDAQFRVPPSLPFREAVRGGGIRLGSLSLENLRIPPKSTGQRGHFR